MLGDKEGIILRVKQLIELSGLKKSRFAIEVGINASNFGKKLVGNIGFSDNDIKLISKKLNVRIGWLLTGEGQMYIAPEGMRQQVAIDSYRAKKLNEEANEERMSHESSTILEIYSKTIRQLEDERAQVKVELQALAILHQQIEKELGEVRDLKAMLHDAISAIRSSSVNNNTMPMAAEDN
jgi:hypothetical protein